MTSEPLRGELRHRDFRGSRDARRSSALRRACNETRRRPPELLLLRIKELWTKIAGAPRLVRDEKDRRYLVSAAGQW